MKQHQPKKKVYLFFLGTLIGATVLSIAFGSVPRKGTVTDDTALYQNLSEIRARKAKKIDFDEDLARLNRVEGKYAEKLPHLQKPMERIAKQRYVPAAQDGQKTAKRNNQANTVRE